MSEEKIPDLNKWMMVSVYRFESDPDCDGTWRHVGSITFSKEEAMDSVLEVTWPARVRVMRALVQKSMVQDNGAFVSSKEIKHWEKARRAIESLRWETR